ncbi:MAG: hypothetical protein NTW19_05305 [Planctomycetota bacterium]|nr:hypothetical protein [Planctomycetota bacterium]
MTFIERRVYGSNSFIEHQRATRALLKFCDDRGHKVHAVGEIRACLAALEAGEESNAVAAFGRVYMGKEGFNEWWPPAIPPSETKEYACAVFEALVERWSRMMSSLAGKR